MNLFPPLSPTKEKVLPHTFLPQTQSLFPMLECNPLPSVTRLMVECSKKLQLLGDKEQKQKYNHSLKKCSQEF
jgi:hypothetical protein